MLREIQSPAFVTQPLSNVKIDFKISQETYDDLALRLAKLIFDSSFIPSAILAISREGVPLGERLSSIFERPLAIIAASSNIEDEKFQSKTLKIADHISQIAPFGDNILLVDNIAGNSVTLSEISKNVLSQNQSATLRTAVIWKKTDAVFNPDYYVESIDINIRIIQPFERYSPRLLDTYLNYATNTPSRHFYPKSQIETALRLAKIIRDSDFEFDTIVNIVHAGEAIAPLPLGDFLSRVFNKPLAFLMAGIIQIHERSFSDHFFQKSRLVLAKYISCATNDLGKKILLVSDGGDSVALQKAKEKVKQLYNPLSIRTAMLSLTYNKYPPDYLVRSPLHKDDCFLSPSSWVSELKSEGPMKNHFELLAKL